MKVPDFWNSLMKHKVAVWLEQRKWGPGVIRGDKVREVTVRQEQIMLGFWTILRTLASVQMISEAVVRL